MKFHVPDMSCDGCLRSVTKAVTTLDPAARVTADHPTRTIEVETSASAEAVGRALADAGCPASAA